MPRLADIERAAARVAALVLEDEGFAPVLDRLQEEIERHRRGSARDKARAFLRAAGEKT